MKSFDSRSLSKFRLARKINEKETPWPTAMVAKETSHIVLWVINQQYLPKESAMMAEIALLDQNLIKLNSIYNDIWLKFTSL